MKNQPRAGGRGATLIAALVLLVASISALAGSLSASPPINKDLRAQSPYGDWRQVPSAAFYDAGEYYFEMGYAYVAALVRDYMAEARGKPRPFADRAALRTEARDLLAQALRRSPADAQAWAALALVAATERDEEMHTKALRRSWALAPYSASIARLRLMALVVAPPGDPGPDARAAIRRDVRVMRRFEPGSVERLRQVSPLLDALIGSFEGA